MKLTVQKTKDEAGVKKVVHNHRYGWLGLLGIIFVLCKIFAIAPIATWSWWIVLLPFYISIAIVLAIVVGVPLAGGILYGILYLGASAIDKYNDHKRYKQRQKQLMWDKLKGK